MINTTISRLMPLSAGTATCPFGGGLGLPTGFASLYLMNRHSEYRSLVAPGAFRAPAIFAMGRGSTPGGAGSGSLPPAGGAGSRDGGGIGGKPPSGREAARYLAHDMPSIANASELKGRIVTDLALLEGPDHELEYLTDTAVNLTEHSDRIRQIDAGGFLDTLHYMAMAIDGLTESIKASGVEGRPAANPSRALSYISTTAGVLGRILFDRGELNGDPIEMAIDIQRIFAMKGIYYESLMSKPMSGGTRPFLLRTVMALVNVETLYTKIGRGEKAERVRSFIEELKRHHDIPADEEGWIKGTLSAYMTAQILEFIEGEAKAKQRAELYDTDLRTLSRNFNVFSPWMYSESAKLLRDHGFAQLAAGHERRSHEKLIALASLEGKANPVEPDERDVN